MLQCEQLPFRCLLEDVVPSREWGIHIAEHHFCFPGSTKSRIDFSSLTNRADL